MKVNMFCFFISVLLEYFLCLVFFLLEFLSVLSMGVWFRDPFFKTLMMREME